MVKPIKIPSGTSGASPTPAPDGCATCRFSLPLMLPTGAEFLCRRYPPQIKVDGMPAFPQLTIAGWCGEFARPATVTP